MLWLTLHWGILNHIERWRPQIERHASAVLGITVQIGRIEVRTGSWLPAVDLRDVVLIDARKQQALRLPRVSAALSPRSLVALEVRFEQLFIEAAELEVRRDAGGRIYIGGLDFNAAAPEHGSGAADWLFKQREVVVRGATLRWSDEQRSAPPLALTDVSLVMRNGLRHHDLRLDATPPPVWGERFTLQGRFTQPLLAGASDWRRWSGTLSAELPRADVRELRRYLSLPFDWSSGEGALRAWLDIEAGQPREVTLDVAMRAVVLRLASSALPLDFTEVQGRFTAQRKDDGVNVQARQFGFVTGDGLRWPRGDLAFAWRQQQSGSTPQPVTGGAFSAERLDLGLMTQIAARVPLGDALQRLLAELAPQGVVHKLSARWDGPLDAPTHYEVKGQCTDLSLAALPSHEAQSPGRPGVRHADIEFSATEKGGRARMALQGGALEFPGVFEEPLVPLDKLAAQLIWRVTPPAAGNAPAQLELKVSDASFANADAQGALSATWRSGVGSEASGRGGRFPGQLELSGKLARAAAARTARYLPLGLPHSVRSYVEHAVTGGSIQSAEFRVKGDLWDFPFVNAKQGEFHIAVKLADVNFAYVPSTPATAAQAAFESPWPALSKVSGELVFDHASMEVRGASARFRDVELSQIRGGIRNLADRSVLALEWSSRGPLADMLAYVNSSPVGGWIGDALRQASASGVSDLKLALNIPLYDVDKSSVKGSVVLAGNDVRLRPDAPLFGATRARVEFSERNFGITGASARVLGGDASFEGGLRPDGSLRFTGQGIATADGMRRSAETPALARLAAALTGQAAYRINLGYLHGLPEFSLSSNLVGLGIDLPAPLRKAPQTGLALRVQSNLAPESLAPNQAVRDTLRLDLGTLVHAVYVRDLSRDAPVVLRGGIGVNDNAPSPASGVAANLRLDSVDTDAWSSSFADSLAAGGASAGAGVVGAGASSDSRSSAGYMPTSIALRAQELNAGARRVTNLVAGISRDEQSWRANVEADQLSGYVEYRSAQGGNSNGQVVARLARLSLARSESDAAQSLLDAQPASVPALDIVVDDFELRGKRLGRVEIEALNRGTAGGAREWQLSRFHMTTPDATLSAIGSWGANASGVAGNARQRAVMDFKLDLANSGAFLERLGTGKSLKGGKGRLTGQVAWIGSPLSPDFTNMTGQVNLAIEAGQFLKGDPGVGRLLGVLSLQSLPRRLALDFRDLFQEGFAFDSVTGDVKIAQGVASTNNLRMRGVSAVVLIEGSADIAHETQDLRVVVVPEINAGTASLAYAAINPAIGLGTFLAQMFLRRPMMQAGTREFRVTGPWVDPKVERVERKFNDPIPELDAPAAPASAPASSPGR